MLIHFLEAWSLLGAVHFISQHILEVWLIIGLCLAKIYSMPCIRPYTFWSVEIWLLYGPLPVPWLEAWLLIGTCLLIGTKEYSGNALPICTIFHDWNWLRRLNAGQNHLPVSRLPWCLVANVYMRRPIARQNSYLLLPATKRQFDIPVFHPATPRAEKFSLFASLT